MAKKILKKKEKRVQWCSIWQKLCKQCVTEYEKLTKPPENGNVTEVIEAKGSQDQLASDDDFLFYKSPKKKPNSTLGKH